MEGCVRWGCRICRVGLATAWLLRLREQLRRRASASSAASRATASHFALTSDSVRIATFVAVSSAGHHERDLACGVPVVHRQGGHLEAAPWPADATDGQEECSRARPPARELGPGDEVALSGGPSARAGALTLVAFDAEGLPVVEWFLTNAWPSRFEVGARLEGYSWFIIEEVMIVAEDIQRLAP